jgi:SAM-dependent methyltransferase
VPDVLRVVRAVATNQLARFAPAAYVRLTGQTGRGDAEGESAADIAAYFRQCADAYFDKLGVPRQEAGGFLRGKVLLEYGPGDLPGVATLMVARGAEKVYCVDRFPLVKLSPKNVQALQALIEGCGGVERDRLLSCLRDPADPAAGFAPARIEYLVRPSGLSELKGCIDLVFSRAVLEHVDHLEATFSDMVAALKPGAWAVHQVDLSSHRLHRHNPLDFLTWSPALWSLMYSEKGVPNRWRIDKYRAIVGSLPVEVLALEPTKLADPRQVSEVRPLLHPAFAALSDEDLAWLGCWLVFRKREPA